MAAGIRIKIDGPLFKQQVRDGIIDLEKRHSIENLAAKGEALVRMRVLPGYGYRTGAYLKSLKGVVIDSDFAVVRPTVGQSQDLAIKSNAIEGRYGFIRKSGRQLKTLLRKEQKLAAEAIAEKLDG